jgi:hypothetical protein
MSNKSFLFTYSVSPLHDHDKDCADIIRNRIARLDGENGWVKLDRVETAFKGMIDITKVTLESKREEAEKKVSNILQTVFDEKYPSHKVWISVALLVNELGGAIEFRF